MKWRKTEKSREGEEEAGRYRGKEGCIRKEWDEWKDRERDVRCKGKPVKVEKRGRKGVML